MKHHSSAECAGTLIGPAPSAPETRIGISAIYQLQGGALANLRQLLPRWSRSQAVLRTRLVLYTRADSLPLLEGVLDPTIDVRVLPSWRRFPTLRRLAWEQIQFPDCLARDRIDVLFCSGNIAPWRSRVPTVVVFHNAAPFCPLVTRRAVGWRQWLSFRILRSFMLRTARRASRVVFLSHYLRAILERQHGLPADRGCLIYQGKDASPAAAAAATPVVEGRYVACVSHLYRYKGILQLLRGFAMLRLEASLGDVKLVLVGAAPDRGYRREIEREVKRLDLNACVAFTGALPHEKVIPILRGADAFVFPSLCENCPNALIEALALGLPIAAADAAAIPEIAGEAAVYFDPQNPADIASAMRQVLTHPGVRKRLREQARARAAALPDWDDVATATMEVLTAAARAGGTRSRLEA